jgi:glucose/arabinose dehydrogenase
VRRTLALVLLSLAAAYACNAHPSASPPADASASPPADASVSPPADASASPPADASASPPADASASPPGEPDGSILHPCTLPGSIQHTASGAVVVPGGGAGPDLGFIQVPVGFCVHYYGTVPDARQLRFAPGGELFVASPTTATTGGVGGLAAIVVLPDDDRDGVADSTLTYLGSLPSTQGLLFTGGFLYYQDATRIMRVPYATGDRTPSGTSQQVADITVYTSTLHWPKTLDVADDGTLYVGNGGDQGETCEPTHPFHGGILALDGSPGGAPVAKGLRNPIAVRCARGHDHCFAVELGKDSSMAPDFGREKIVPIRQGDDWGFPCCATQNTPYAGITPVPDCSGVAAESDAFYIGDTPFGIDFESGLWPAPWTGYGIVTLHGSFGLWTGERVVGVAMDPTTGMPVSGSDLEGGDTGGLVDFATGWDDGLFDHGRPASVTFSRDGRLFIGNDNDGTIVWIAPMTL